MPETLGRFRILEPLGADFIGSRYLAFDPQISRQVVLRTLDPASEDAAGLVREHFLQEARTAARLSHPNIIKVFGIHTEEPQPFVVLENLEGPSLEDLLAESGPLSVERTVRLIGPVADALDFAHADGVIHRDVRPGAIIVMPGDQPTLTGFVMAKMADVVSAVTRQGLAVGTPGYASPELVTGGAADRRGDIFSLGAVVYEALTGRQVFVGRNMAETLYRIAHADPEPPSSLVEGLDERHDRMLLRALAKSPEQRQQSMGEFRTELEAWLVPVEQDVPIGTDETVVDLRSSDLGDTDKLPVFEPGDTCAEMEPEKVEEPEPEPPPEPEPAVEPVPVPVVAKERPASPGRRPKLVPAIAVAAAVVLVTLLSGWQFGWFGSGPAAEAEIEDAEVIAPVEQMADADSATGEDPYGELEDAAVGGEAEAVDTIPEPPADQSAGDSDVSNKEPADPEPVTTPPEETVVAPPPLPAGVLEVASLPWARVTVDGQARGETPLRIGGLAEGEHRLSLSGAGGLQWSGVVTVRGNRSTYFYHNFREGG